MNPGPLRSDQHFVEKVDVTFLQIAKERIRVNADTETFLKALVTAREIQVLPITVEVAARAQSPLIPHGDPADRLIAATALVHDATLVTRDEKLRGMEGLRTVW